MRTVENYPILGSYCFRLWLWSWPVRVSYSCCPQEKTGGRANTLAQFEFMGVAVSVAGPRQYSCAVEELKADPYHTALKQAWQYHLEMREQFPYLFQPCVELAPYWKEGA